MSQTFRTSPVGFNKKDVVDYIEKLVAERDADMARLREEISGLEKQVSELEGYRDKAEELETQVSSLEEKISGIEEQNVQLESRLEESARQLEESEKAHSGLQERLDDSLKELEETEKCRAEHERTSEELRAQLEEERDRSSQLNCRIDDLREENVSLKKHNLRLLELNEELKCRPIPEEKAEVKAQLEEKPTGAGELFSAFKTRLLEISTELSSLAQAILDAEKREAAEEQAVPAQPQECVDAGIDEESGEEISTGCEIPPKGDHTYSKKGLSVREIIERLRTIGDRLI